MNTVFSTQRSGNGSKVTRSGSLERMKTASAVIRTARMVRGISATRLRGSSPPASLCCPVLQRICVVKLLFTFTICDAGSIHTSPTSEAAVVVVVVDVDDVVVVIVDVVVDNDDDVVVVLPPTSVRSPNTLVYIYAIFLSASSISIEPIR